MRYGQRQPTNVFASKSNQNTAKAEFELQELRAQLDAMKKAQVTAQNTRPEKRQELTDYLLAVVSQQSSPIPLKRIADDGAAALHGKWRLAFSTNDNTLAELPFESTAFLNIQPDYTCDYILSFSKRVMGLNGITAKCTYYVETSPVNSPGQFTFTYQEVKTDIMGFKNIGVGMFGLLKGRVSNVYTCWFDGDIWIERVYDMEGRESLNIYTRES